MAMTLDELDAKIQEASERRAVKTTVSEQLPPVRRVFLFFRPYKPKGKPVVFDFVHSSVQGPVTTVFVGVDGAELRVNVQELSHLLVSPALSAEGGIFENGSGSPRN